MREIRATLFISTSILAGLVLGTSSIYADETQEQIENENVTTVLSDGVNKAIDTNREQLLSSEQISSEDQKEPKVTDVEIEGEPNNFGTGVEVFDPVKVVVNTENFTNDNLLTPEGLGWSDETQVIPITGQENGVINNPRYWGQNNPTTEVTAYTFNNGDSGRITNIGKTLAGTKLDLIYTVEDSDAKDWLENSGLKSDGRVKGIAFTGEQYIENTSNNSIVVLYNGANAIQLGYRIVKHDTFEEQKVLVSFITTDIDVGQGVSTDLANLAVVIPSETNLSIKENVIYDSSHTGPWGYGADLNGANGLPYGGYLGIAFLSRFTYTFFAPAPANDDIYKYATGVRYDLFGSALQTKMVINRKTKVKVKYIDDQGNQIQNDTILSGINDFPTIPKAPMITGYKYLDTKTESVSSSQTVLSHVYVPEFDLKIEYLNEDGKKILSDEILKVTKGTLTTLVPKAVVGYELPSEQIIFVTSDQTVHFIYTKKSYQVMVEFVDDQGSTLRKPKTIVSTYGSVLNFMPREILGYKTPKHKELTVRQNEIIRFIYERKQYTVNIEYVDKAGQKIAKEQIIKALWGDELKFVPAQIPGYTLPTEKKIKVTGHQTIRFTYIPVEVPIKLEYVDNNGKVLTGETVKIEYGDEIVFQPPMFAGYKMPSKVSIVAKHPRTLRVVYNRLPTVIKTITTPVSKEPIIRRMERIRSVALSPQNQTSIVSRVTVSSPLNSKTAIESSSNVNITGITLPKKWSKLGSMQKNSSKKEGIKSGGKVKGSTSSKKSSEENNFQKNTGINKQDQKLLFEVLEKIERYGKRKGHSSYQIKLDQLYYLAATKYVDDSPQKALSSVGKYTETSLGKILGDKSKAKKFFERFGNKEKKIEKQLRYRVDLPHMAVTGASTMDRDIFVEIKQFLATQQNFPFWISLAVDGRTAKERNKLWAFINGYYGDKIMDRTISEEDYNADMDVYQIIKNNKSLSKQLKELYGQDSSSAELTKRRNEMQQEMDKKTALLITELGLETLLLFVGYLLKNRRDPNKIIRENHKVLKKVTKNVVDTVTSVVRHPIKTAKKVGQAIKVVAKNTITRVKTDIRKVTRTVNRYISSPVKKIIKKSTHTIKNVTKKVAQPIMQTIKKVVRPIKRVVTTVKYKAKRTVQRVVKASKKIVRKTISTIKRPIRRVIPKVVKRVQHVTKTVKRVVRNVVKKLIPQRKKRRRK